MKKFEVGERVQFIYEGKLQTGIIEKLDRELVDIPLDGGTLYTRTDEIMKLDQPKPVKVPKIIADFIKEYEKITCENKQGRDFTRAELLSTIWDSLGAIHADRDIESAWLRENFDKLIEAVMYDYVVEEEKKYYVQVISGDYGFLNCRRGNYSLNDKKENGSTKTKFTEKEIKAIDDRLWAFAVPVEEEVEAE